MRIKKRIEEDMGSSYRICHSETVKKEMSFEILRVIGLSQNIKHLYVKSMKSTLSTDFFANMFFCKIGGFPGFHRYLK